MKNHDGLSYVIMDRHERFLSDGGWTSLPGTARKFPPRRAAMLLLTNPGTCALRVSRPKKFRVKSSPENPKEKN